MFDPLLEEDPWVKEKVANGEARGEARGRAEGVAEGVLKEARDLLVRFVQRYYPTLIDLAKARAMQGEQPGALNALLEQLWGANDEQAARTLLEHYSVS